MCGRVRLSNDHSEIKIKLNIADLEPPKERRSMKNDNAAPSQMLPVVRQHPVTGKRTIDELKWGLIPHWTKRLHPDFKPNINARAERVATAPTFREAYAKRRCLVPMNGYYEWAEVPGKKKKQPHFITMKDRSTFCVAGIWENWNNPKTGEWVRSFTMITTEPNELCATIHDRMPVIIEPADYDCWLGSETDPGDLLRSYPAEKMEAWAVSTRVNLPGNNDASLLFPA